MTTLLSDYLRSLEPDRELTAEAYESAREGLRGLLFGELRRRGLWGGPPRYLGIVGDRWPGEAIDELVSECYAEIFVERLKRLKARALVGNDVGGLIVRCVRNFVQDRQQGNDPLGYKLYGLVSESLRRLADARRVRLVPDSKVTNDTLCAFGAIPEVVPEVDLDVQVRALNDDLWPQLIVAHGRARAGLDERLDGHLAGLAAAAEAFLFRDLIEPLKRDIRARWRDGVAAEVAGWGAPATDHDLGDVRDCVARRIEQEGPKNREGLRRLWVFLCDYAAGTNPSPVAEKAEKSGRPPTELGLEKALGDSRHHIAGFKKTLGKMIRQCRSAVSGKGSVKRSVEVGLARMERHKELRSATRRAVSAWSTERAEIAAAPRTPRPGDTFVFPGSGDLLVEWLVIEEVADGRVLVVAVDDRPGTGSRDVALDPDGAAGLATARCALDVTLDIAALDPQRRTGSIPAAALERVRSKRAALVASSVVPSLAEQEIDEDPQYQNRMEELGEVRAALAESSPAERAAVLPFQSKATSKGPVPGFFAVAASVLLVVGLGGLAMWQQSRITSLEEELQGTPHPNLPVIWLTADELVRGEDDPFVVSTGARRLALILEVTSPKIYPRYRVEIVEGEPPKEIWASDQLIKSGSELSFDLPRSLLGTGGYELRIYGLTAAEEPSPEIEAEVLERYTLWIELE